jgi:ribosomal protein S18 acetylase RimI-like enzyme
MKPTSIRAATAADAPAAQACVAAAFERYIVRIGRPPAPMMADYAALIAQGAVWVTGQAGRVDGVLVLYDVDEGRQCYLDTVAVAPARQGEGLGRALIEFAEREAVRRGFDALHLRTNVKMVENQTLYPKLGYVEVERRSDGGFERVFYRKALG